MRLLGALAYLLGFTAVLMTLVALVLVVLVLLGYTPWR